MASSSKSNEKIQGSQVQGAVASQDDDDDQWSQVQTDRELVLFDQCEKKGLKPTIVGWLWDEVLVKEETATMPAFVCLAMRLTKPVKIANKEGVVYEVPANTDVLVPKTNRLEGLADVAKHPTDVLKIRITPIEKKEIGGGKTLRRYQVEKSDKIASRAEIAPLTVGKYAALTAGQAQNIAAALPPALANDTAQA